MKNTIAVILAAGKGTRLNNGSPSELPKVLHRVNNKPLISYCLDSLKKAGLNDVVVVVGYKGDLVKESIGDSVKYAYQDKQLGTSHAVYKAKEFLKDKAKYLIVLNGDNPFFSTKTFEEIIKACREKKATVAIATAEFNNPTGLGRVIKDTQNHVVRIVEEKEATEDEKKIKEINAGLYCFDNKWLWENIVDVELSPHGEYYITDLIGMAVSEKEKVIAYKIEDNREAIGINTLEHLKHANKIINEIK